MNFIQGGYRLRSPFGHMNDEDFTNACVDDLVQVIDMMTAGDVACLIAEPIQGVGGFATPPDGFFGELNKVLANHQILLVVDEVQTGWGRTGEHFWGYQAHDVVPDMLTFAKGVGNGATLAGIVARAEIMDTISVLSFSTFGGKSPLVCSRFGHAALCARQRPAKQCSAKGSTTDRRACTGRRKNTVDCRNCAAKGLMQAIETVHPGSTEPDAQRAGAILEGCKRRGLLVGKGGLYGNAIRITPMLDVSAAELNEGISAIIETIEEIS